MERAYDYRAGLHAKELFLQNKNGALGLSLRDEVNVQKEKNGYNPKNVYAMRPSTLTLGA